MSRIRDFFTALRARAEAWPWLTIILLLAAQTVPAIIWSRELWHFDEVRHANILQNLLSSNDWTVLRLNGQIYPDKPPFYFWFLALLSKLFQSDRPFVFFTGLALSAGILLAATWFLARRTGGPDKRVALAATMVLLTNLPFATACHWARMDLMFSALIALSQTCLFLAWTRAKPGGWAVAGFALAGVAVLTKGPFGFIFPFLSSLFFLGWHLGLKRGLRRLVCADALTGLALALAIPAAWLLAAYWQDEVEGGKMIRLIIKDQSARLTNSFVHQKPFYFYALILPVFWLPWSLLLCGVQWRRFFTASFWAGLWADRRQADRGTVFLWATVLAAFLALSSVSIKLEVYIFPLFAPLAVLTARQLFALPAASLRRVWAGMAVFYFLIAVMVAGIFNGSLFALPSPARGLVAVAVLFALLGLTLFLLRRRAPGHLLACLLAGMTLSANLITLVVMPSLDPVMSPKVLGERLGALARQGYFPASYQVYDGLHSYYARSNVCETRQIDELLGQLDKHPRIAFLIKRTDWDEWTNRPPGLRIVAEQYFVEHQFVLLVVRDGAAP